LYVGHELRVNTIFELVQSIITRTLFFMSPMEMMNLCEFVYKGNINMIKKAYLTFNGADDESQQRTEVVKPHEFINGFTQPVGQVGQKVVIDRKQTKVDVTSEIRKQFKSYFTIFGTKVIDFNSDNSPFNTFRKMFMIPDTIPEQFETFNK